VTPDDEPFATRIDPFRDRHVVHEGYTVLLTQDSGRIGGEEEGLFDFDTRILSQYRLTLDGEEPSPLDATSDSNRWRARLLVQRPGGSAEGPLLPQDTIEIEIERRVGCGMEESLTLRNHSMAPVSTEVAIELDADFADRMSIGGETQQIGETTVTWKEAERALTFNHRAEHDGNAFGRALRVTVAEADSAPRRDGATLLFHLNLPPRGEWRATLGFASLVDGAWRDRLGADALTISGRARERAEWRHTRTRMKSSNQLVASTFERAAEDLFSLRNWELDTAPDAWIPNAGVPSYTGVFGRDVLTAGWQGALLGPEMMRGSFAVLAATQATEDSAWRDEEPGKLLHEARRGPLSDLGLLPQRAYYGEQTAPAMFVIALSEAWHWTGDLSLLERYAPTALRAMEWARKHGDRDGDGLLEYVSRSSKGLKNQGWKDSNEAIRYPDGRLVENPIATIEEQAYYFIALQRMAEMALLLGDEERAEGFLAESRRLYERVNDLFWMEDEQYYAVGLDAEKRPIRTITSNPGHALGAGIVPPDRARAVADRLLADDLFSGWGVRTLSTAHPSYNPYAYHLGTVWPVENATFALGLKRYGLDDHADRLIAAMLDAAQNFSRLRLPEALSGHARRAGEPPGIYPHANSPQAWSASATVQMIQLQLGMMPFAAAGVLALIRPRLPAWLPDLTLHQLRVGDATISVRFRRRDDGTADHEVIHRGGALRIVEVPPPNDVDFEGASRRDRLLRWAVRRAPGATARALRIAMGVEPAPPPR
jgi:glycogen debranching enzyme